MLIIKKERKDHLWWFRGQRENRRTSFLSLPLSLSIIPEKRMCKTRSDIMRKAFYTNERYTKGNETVF